MKIRTPGKNGKEIDDDIFHFSTHNAMTQQTKREKSSRNRIDFHGVTWSHFLKSICPVLFLFHSTFSLFSFIFYSFHIFNGIIMRWMRRFSFPLSLSLCQCSLFSFQFYSTHLFCSPVAQFDIFVNFEYENGAKIKAKNNWPSQAQFSMRPTQPLACMAVWTLTFGNVQISNLNFGIWLVNWWKNGQLSI